MLLYVLSGESLYHAMRCNTNIKGIHIKMSDKVALVFQHADDTTMTISDTEVLQVLNYTETHQVLLLRDV